MSRPITAMHDSRARLAWYALAALFAAFVYFYGLDSEYIPKNGDEFPYEHITRLTAASGHLLPLQSQLDNMRNTKPPLLFWQGIASTGWGQDWTQWQLRYPSVIYTLLTAILVMLLAARLAAQQGAKPIETGATALLVYLAFFSTYRYGRPFLVNPPEVFWLFLPVFTLLYWQPASFGSRFAVPLALGLETGIGLLYKSFALVAPVGLGLAWWYLHRRGYRWRAFFAEDAWKPVMAGILALGLFGLWFALDPDPQSVWREFIVGENVGKFDPHGGSYLAKLLWGGSSVWALLLGYPMNAGLLAFPVAALFFIAYRHRAQLSETEKLLWIWIIVFFAVFSVPSQRSSRYLLEAMPALAVLCALNWQRIGRAAFMLSLVLTAGALALAAFLALQLQREMAGGLYPVWFWLLLLASAALIALALLNPRLTRALTSVAVLLAYLCYAAFLHPFDGAPGNYSPEARQDVRGKAVWVPCDFRAKDEGHRFLLPGAEVHGYYEAPELTPAELAKRYRLFAARLPLQADAGCAGCKLIGQRLELRSRQSEAEIKDMLRGNVLPHLFVKEVLVESAAAPAVPVAEESCR
jgi:4-amino-4-deoxy-L-arabinose transferase-like glycosyltransferase